MIDTWLPTWQSSSSSSTEISSSASLATKPGGERWVGRRDNDSLLRDTLGWLRSCCPFSKLSSSASVASGGDNVPAGSVSSHLTDMCLFSAERLELSIGYATRSRDNGSLNSDTLGWHLLRQKSCCPITELRSPAVLSVVWGRFPVDSVLSESMDVGLFKFGLSFAGSVSSDTMKVGPLKVDFFSTSSVSSDTVDVGLFSAASVSSHRVEVGLLSAGWVSSDTVEVGLFSGSSSCRVDICCTVWSQAESATAFTTGICRCFTEEEKGISYLSPYVSHMRVSWAGGAELPSVRLWCFGSTLCPCPTDWEFPAEDTGRIHWLSEAWRHSAGTDFLPRSNAEFLSRPKWFCCFGKSFPINVLVGKVSAGKVLSLVWLSIKGNWGMTAETLWGQQGTCCTIWSLVSSAVEGGFWSQTLVCLDVIGFRLTKEETGRTGFNSIFRFGCVCKGHPDSRVEEDRGGTCLV